MTTSVLTRRRIVIGGIVLVAIAAGLLFARNSLSASTETGILTTTVVRGDVEETVLATGTFKPVKLVAVGAQVSGRITALHVKLGEEIKAGALVAEIDSVTQKNSLRTAEAALANVKAQRVEKAATLTNAQLTLDRQKSIYESKAGPKSDLDSAEATVKETEAQIDALDAQITSAEVAVETANANLAYTRITAPMDGTILAIVNQEGQTVNAAQSAPTIVILGQLSTMTVRAEISEADVVNVKAGQLVYFTIIGDSTTRHDAVLQSIEPAPESITSDSSVLSSSSSTTSSTSSSTSAIYYNGIFDVPNTDGRFRTYMSAEVHIVLGSAKDVLTVPSSALEDAAKTGANTVRVMDSDGKLTNRKVTVGINDSVKAEIRDGLSEGEKVVIGQASATSAPTNGGGGPPPMGF